MLGFALLASCSGGGPPAGATSVFLTVRDQSSRGFPDELRLTARGPSGVIFQAVRLPESGPLMPVGGSLLGTVTLYLGGAEGDVEIDVVGRAAGMVVRQGTTTVHAVASHQVTAEVVLRDDSGDAGVGDGGTGGAGGAQPDAGVTDADVDDAVDGAGGGDGGGDAPTDVTVDRYDAAADGPAPDAPATDGPAIDVPPDGPANDSSAADGMTGNPDGGGSDAASGPQPFLRLRFDETSGTVADDSSGNNRDGTLFGATHIANGRIGGAVHLDGMAGTYVALPANLLDAVGAVTIATWVRVGVASTYSKVFDFGSGSARTMSLAAQWSNGPLRFVITTNGMLGDQVLQGTAPLPTGVWTHVAVVLGASGGTLYVDGAMVATDAGVTLRPPNLAPTPNVWLGRSQMASTPNLDCDLDDFRIYDRALTAAEVAAIHGATQ